jgi:hypothetical protein
MRAPAATVATDRTLDTLLALLDAAGWRFSRAGQALVVEWPPDCAADDVAVVCRQLAPHRDALLARLPRREPIAPRCPVCGVAWETAEPVPRDETWWMCAACGAPMLGGWR